MNRRRRGTRGLFVIVPVNVLKSSKTRLAPLLGATGGSSLSAAMLLDVLRALRKVKRAHTVTVVSADVSVRKIARPMRAHFLWEGTRRGLNKGVQLALRDALQRKASAALILPSDIPLVTSLDIDRFLSLSDGYPVALVPSKDGSGTNALLLRPPGVIGPAFGKDSFRRHLAMAKKRGLATRVVRLRSIAFDVDEPADLTHLRRRSLRNETGRFLSSLKLRGLNQSLILALSEGDLISNVRRTRETP